MVAPAPRSDASRRTGGTHWFILLGRKQECRNKKEILIEGLRAIESERPGTLEKLSKFKRRTRRIVARDRMDLFDVLSLRRAIDKYSTRVTDEWWVGTNNSGPETEAWLRRACEYAGLAWGENFRTSL